jgi:NTE family protein
MTNGPEVKTAFVLAGGGSLGALQVGMLRELVRYGLRPDLVVGSSVGAINGAYFAADPSAAGVASLERIWTGLEQNDVFPLTAVSVLRLLSRRTNLVNPGNL